MLLLIVNGSTIVLESVILHGSVYIALGSFFRFLQSVVVQLIIEAVFKVMVDGNQIATLLFCFKDIAQILGIGRTSAYILVKEGHFKIVRIGNAIRISKRSFDEWLDSLDL